jgi:DNA mismatch endonuclease, patch repair protein
MTDVHDKNTRSYNMSRIRSKDTKPEMIVRKFLHSQGFRYRLHVKYLPGKPDIVLPKYKTVIFVHGCFWHGHENCKLNRIPKRNKKYWIPKIKNNKNRDYEDLNKLNLLGWKRIIVWECKLAKTSIDETFLYILNNIKIDEIH